jgi:hypothetical protein
VRVVFDWSASDNLIPPSAPISLPVLSENEMNSNNFVTVENEFSES